MDLKDILLKEGIIKIKGKDEESFTLKSGKKSKLFIDIKEASLNPEILKEITDLTKELFDEFIFTNNKVDKIASVAIGGVPIATALSLKTKIPQIIVRSEKHDRGTQTQVIGDNGKGNLKDKKCILIEDVATSGGSIINAINALHNVGAICNDVIIIVDREEGAQELCDKNHINLYPILKKSDFGLKE